MDGYSQQDTTFKFDYFIMSDLFSGMKAFFNLILFVVYNLSSWTFAKFFLLNCLITCGWHPQRDTIFEFDYFISLVRWVGCFLFSLLSTSFARFSSQLVWMCCCSFLVFFTYLPISSLTVATGDSTWKNKSKM